MKYFLPLLFLALISSTCVQAQSFPNPSTLSTGQGTPGSYDPIWTVSQWYSTNPPNPIGLSYTPALINNNCAPGSWVNPASLPPPANNGNWITGTTTSCSNNYNDGYLYFRLTLNLPTDCNGNSVTTAGNYVLYLDGYVDNQITDIFVNGASTGISGGGFSAGSQLSITLPGPWIQGTNYIDVQVYNYPNGGNNNPYGLLLVANTQASSTADGDGDGVADINDQCPCTQGQAPSGCPPASISGNTSICSGQSTTLTASGGGTYMWSTGATTASITVTPGNSAPYSVTTTQTSGFTSSASVNVTVNSLPNPTISPATAAVCPGGSITLTAGGGTGYVWSTSATTAAVTVSPAGTTSYSVTVTDANNCTASTSRTVAINPLPTASITPAAAAVCPGTSTTLTASGGTSYAWSTTANTAAITVSPAGSTSYTVTVTDANNCTASASRSVAVYSPPSAAITPAAVAICAGGSTTLTAGGGTGYVWSTSATTAAITVSPAGTTSYTVTVTDANTCTASASRSVTVNPLPTPAITPASVVVCTGSSTTLTASGGTGYAWSTTATTPAVTVTPAGTTSYTVTVTDANNCSASVSRSVSVVPLPTPVISPATTSVCASSSLTLTASGGTSFLWSTTDVTSSITVTPAGNPTYTVTVTDGNNCTASLSRTITVDPLPIITFTPASAAVCAGSSITLTAGGGTGYIWSTSATTQGITVSPGVTTAYDVTVTSASNCTASASKSVTVNQPPVPSITPSAAAICVGDAATLTASGGTGYNWSNGDITASTSVSPSGTTTYTATVTDANNCTASTTATVTVNPLPVPAISPASPAVCTGSSTTLTASGGVVYSWSTTDMTASISVSPSVATSYAVTVTDGNNCSAAANTSVAVNPLPAATINPATASVCAGSGTTLTAGGGTSYLWSTGSSSAAINPVPAGTATYDVTVTDANSCTATTSATVTVYPLPVPAITTTAASICVGGTTTLTATGGTSYVWSDGSTSASVPESPATTTTYGVTATDANNCSASASQLITVIPAMQLIATPAMVTCHAGADGSISLAISGGQAPYTYLWSNTSTSQNINNLAAGSFAVSVTDHAGCTATTAATVAEPTAVTITPATTDPLCASLPDNGSIALTAGGGTPSYTYLWADGSTAAAQQNLAPGSYAITVTDAQGCSAVASVTLAYVYDFTIQASPAISIRLGENTTLSYAVTGHSGTLSSVWTPDYGLSCTDCGAPVASPGRTTLYQVKVANDEGCTAGDSTTVTVISDYSVFVPNAFTPNDDGTNDFFEFYGNKKSIKFVDVEVFDRWGESVFRSNDVNFRWDGTYRGVKVEPGNFVWQMSLTFVDGHNSTMQKGSLTVIR